jgi:hypothetical protein
MGIDAGMQLVGRRLGGGSRSSTDHAHLNQSERVRGSPTDLCFL